MKDILREIWQSNKGLTLGGGWDVAMPSDFDPHRYIVADGFNPMPVRKRLWKILCVKYMDEGMPYGLTTEGVVVWLEAGLQEGVRIEFVLSEVSPDRE